MMRRNYPIRPLFSVESLQKPGSYTDSNYVIRDFPRVEHAVEYPKAQSQCGEEDRASKLQVLQILASSTDCSVGERGIVDSIIGKLRRE